MICGSVQRPSSPIAQLLTTASLTFWACAALAVLMYVSTIVDAGMAFAWIDVSGTPAMLATKAMYATMSKSSTGTSKVELKTTM